MITLESGHEKLARYHKQNQSVFRVENLCELSHPLVWLSPNYVSRLLLSVFISVPSLSGRNTILKFV